MTHNLARAVEDSKYFNYESSNVEYSDGIQIEHGVPTLHVEDV